MVVLCGVCSHCYLVDGGVVWGILKLLCSSGVMVMV